ncbi:hypothetical protein [Methylobacterium nigriterrae]|uniref:hypothetical protein n=1 Tax=Methylobacterium nigriterrae TaxID=3127512 RepID=UPI0030138A2A
MTRTLSLRTIAATLAASIGLTALITMVPAVSSQAAPAVVTKPALPQPRLAQAPQQRSVRVVYVGPITAR